MVNNRVKRGEDSGYPDARLTWGVSLRLALGVGLSTGFVDLMVSAAKAAFLTPGRYLATGRDALWTVPLGHVVLLLPVALGLWLVNAIVGRRISVGAAVWLLATLGLWGALARLPLHTLASLVLAAGLGLEASHLVMWRLRGSTPRRLFALTLVVVFAGLFVASTGAEAVRVSQTRSRLTQPSGRALNVVLLVWDTVRAHNVSALGYPRPTTPNLDRWAARGVRFRRALTTAPWTLPAHSSLFTGYWPYQLDTQWKHRLGPEKTTLAEFLAAHGYQTTAFVGNTVACSYETGLDRGFAEYHDYALTPWSLLTRTQGGRWLVDQVLFRGRYLERKWLGLQSHEAAGNTDAFLSWLDGRRRDRPFFAFLNLFDVHEPYAMPRAPGIRFGRAPAKPRDLEALFRFGELDKDRIAARDVLLARDCYDSNIAYLDAQFGRLMSRLRDTGLLENTIVILTSDHGEAFGDHGIFGHGSSLFLDEIEVPLVVIAPGLPGGKLVSTPVSLRDLPATVADMLGLHAESPFPGATLAAHWSRPAADPLPQTSVAFSEYANATAFEPETRPTPGHVGFQLSIVRDRTHYVRDGTGGEQLYVLPTDLREQNNIAETVEGAREALGFRELLLETLRESAGSPTVERAYLAECRDWLTALVAEQAAPVSTEGEDDRTEAERLPADTPLPPRADDDGDEDDEG